jgi:hypothetical protein
MFTAVHILKFIKFPTTHLLLLVPARAASPPKLRRQNRTSGLNRTNKHNYNCVAQIEHTHYIKTLTYTFFSSLCRKKGQDDADEESADSSDFQAEPARPKKKYLVNMTFTLFTVDTQMMKKCAGGRLRRPPRTRWAPPRNRTSHETYHNKSNCTTINSLIVMLIQTLCACLDCRRKKPKTAPAKPKQNTIPKVPKTTPAKVAKTDAGKGKKKSL